MPARKTCRSIGLLIVSLVIAGFVSAATAGEPIRIGVTVMQSGANTALGQDFTEGTTMAVEEINARGGVLGRPLRLYYVDDAGDPATAINAVGKLIDLDKVSAIIGPSSSGVVLAVMPIVDRSGIPMLITGATNFKITEQAGAGGNKWVFRLNIDDSVMATALSDVISKEVKSVVIVAANNDYGRGAAGFFQKRLGQNGTKVTSIEYYTNGQADYRPMLTKIKGDKPEGMVVVADAPDAAPMAMQATELGFTNLKVYGRGTVVTPEFLRLTKDPKIWNGAKEANRWAPAGSELEQRYRTRWGREPRVLAVLPYYGIVVLAEAIKMAGSDDRTAVRDALIKINMNIPEIGPVKFDANHQAHHDMFITQWDNGTVKAVSRQPTQ
jgi:branched-chain amino acid transport system substrate-binding protein